jgi:hypothetical protein
VSTHVSRAAEAVAALAARRQIAREAGQDAATAQYGHAGRHHGVGTPDCPRELHHHHDERCEPRSGIDEAIEVATRVRVTDEVVEAAQHAFPVLRDVAEGKRMLEAAFAAAGFEVVE